MTAIQSATIALVTVFGQRTPRVSGKDWEEKDLTLEGKTCKMMQKVLGVGNAGAAQHEEVYEKIFNVLELPVPKIIDQAEWDNPGKPYLISFIKKSDWDTKILPIRNAFDQLSKLSNPEEAKLEWVNRKIAEYKLNT